MHYSPFRRFRRIATVIARLACLIHAANVHSEPGSNPSICCSLKPPEKTRVSPCFLKRFVNHEEFKPRPTYESKGRIFLLHSSLQPAEVFRIEVDHYQIVKEQTIFSTFAVAEAPAPVETRDFTLSSTSVNRPCKKFYLNKNHCRNQLLYKELRFAFQVGRRGVFQDTL